MINLATEPTVSTRIGLENKRGTVKFVGHLNEVDNGQERWVGIDWDKASDGKHDGTFKGKRYFQTRYPTSGSFVKAKQVKVGQGLLATLRKHHFNLYNNVDNDNDVNFVLKTSAAPFERIFARSAINLPNQLVSFLEPDFDKLFIHCTSLCLSNNLLQDWRKLFEILTVFPQLVTLDISYNVLQSLTCNDIIPHRQVKELILNSCRLNHDTLAALAHYFPCLEVLRIMGNELDNVTSLSEFKNLKSLFLGNNPIGDFTKLWHLALLENLEALSLHNCEIGCIELPKYVGFSRLSVLNLNENPLDDWKSINEMGRLSALKNLRTSGLFAGERGCQSYEILVAKLPGLEMLDGCVIDAKERRECEVFFLNKFYCDPILEIHQKDLERLSQIYKEQIQINSIDQVNCNSCIFTLKFGDQLIKRTLLLNLTIRKLVTLASRIFDFDPTDMKVSIQVFEDHYELLDWDSSAVLRAFDPQPDCVVQFVKSVVYKATAAVQEFFKIESETDFQSQNNFSFFFTGSNKDIVNFCAYLFTFFVLTDHIALFRRQWNKNGRSWSSSLNWASFTGTARQSYVGLGVRLECRSITISYAAVYFHKVFPIMPSEFCPYTIACTCISLGAKAVEDQRIRIRHIVSVSYRLLHPNEPPLTLCDLESKLRVSIACMEQVVLRYLRFELKVDCPHNVAYIMGASLRNYFPGEIGRSTKFSIALGTLLQDASVFPEFIIENDPVAAAAVLVSLAIQLLNLKVDDRRWLPLYTEQLNIEKLQTLKKRFLQVVYNEDT